MQNTGSSQCPKCGNQVSQLVPVDTGLKLAVQESGESSVPEQVCITCIKALREMGQTGSLLRAEQKAKDENRINLWTGRVAFVKQGRQMMKSKAYSEAAVAYEKYIRSLEIVFDAKAGTLTPDHFRSKARQTEMTVITSVLWDLICIYDTSPRYGNRMMKCADKLAEFSRFTPIHPNIIKKASNFQRRARNPQVIKRFLKNSGTQRPRCFIATAVFVDHHAPEIYVLRRFRDEMLKEHALGRRAVCFYYKWSPGIARTIDRFPVLRAFFRPPLRLLTAQVRRILRLYSGAEF